MGKTSLVRGISSLVIILSLIFQQTGFAQMAAQIDLSGYLGGLKSSSVQDVYRPAHLRYFSYDNLTDNFKLLLEKGDFFEKQSMVYPDTSVGTGSPLSIDKTKTHEHKNSRTQELKQETKKLMKYFLTGVSLPDDMFWVNLRPDSQDQVIDSWLEKTDVGRIMLEADLQLKKDTAMFTSPETTLGRKYWDKLYKKAAELYGYDNVTIPTLTRPWIVPGEIIVRETKDSAYVYKAVLKVMLEEDYLKNNTVGAALVSAQYEFNDPRAKELNKYSTQLIRELIIPKLTKEINSSKRYSALRQVYYSLILSRWFKMRFSGKQGAYSSLINSSNLTNLTSSESWSKNTYFKQYQKSFSEGEYNIKEPVSTPTGQVIRSYFSGGIQVGPNMGMNVFRTGNNMLYEVLEGMPGIVPIQGMANLGLANLRILPMGKAANREIKTLRASKKASSGISFAAAKKETFDLLKDMRVMTVEELDAKDMVGSYSAEDILNDLARTHWTVKKEGKNYCYRPFRLFTQANERTNLRLLKLLGADGILGGHSEVRKNRKMKDEDVNGLLHKAFKVFGEDSIHIMAMGEPLEMRDDQGNLTEEGWKFLDAQVKNGFEGLSAEQIQKIIIGYEPVWAIGTSKTARPEQAQEVQAEVRAKLPAEIRDSVIIQYGGSMTPDSAAGLIAQVDVDGGLIGGVSLKKESTLALIKVVAEISKGRVPTIVFNLKAAFMEASYLTELMNVFQFIENNLSDVDFEKIHIGFAVADTDIPLFDRALKGENPQNLIDLSNASLSNGLELAVPIDSVSTFEPGARTSEITAAMFEIIKEKKTREGKANITLDEVLTKIEQKFQKDTMDAKNSIDKKGITAGSHAVQLNKFKEEIGSLARVMKLSNEQITTLFVNAISKSVVMTDVGEAGGAKIANIAEAFSRSVLKDILGVLTQDPKVNVLDKQVVLKETGDSKISVIVKQNMADVFNAQRAGHDLDEQIADYFYSMYKQNEGKYITLTFAESDDNDPKIKEIYDYVVELFAYLGISCIRLPMPRLAHTGVEAVMSHPEDILNITIAYTDTYGEGLGTTEIEPGITLDNAIYGYIMSNALRMSLGGTPGVFFEAANRNSLDGIKTTIKSALDKFKAKIQERAAVVAASSSVRFSSAKELVEQLEQKFSDRLKQGNQVVVQEIKQYYDGLGVDDQQIAYEYLQAHESALAADALSAIGLPWNGVVKALVAKIRGEKTGNPRAAARQLNELATKGTCAGLIPPTREIVSEAQRVWSENPQFAGLTKQIEFPEFPVLQADKPGILVLDRHGETYRSVEVLNRWSGGLDTKVTRKGLAEAFESGSSLKGIKFDKAYASALSRAQDTLKQVLLATDQTDIEILTDPAINERNYGTGGMEGWRRSEVERVFGKKVLTKWRRGYDTDEDRPFGGENLLDVQERSVPYFLKNIMVDIAQGKTVIISAHGNSLRAILIELRQHIDNAQVPKAEIEELEVPLSEPIVINFDNKLRVVDIKGPQKVTSFFKLPNVQVQNGKVSSSTQAMPENAGAIDFRGRAMNINYQAMGSFKGLDLKLPRLSSIELNKINIDSEIQQIKKMVSSGISPSGRRIIELAAACEQKGKMSVYSRDLLLCVVGACELAEVNADESSRDFMIALAAIDSRS